MKILALDLSLRETGWAFGEPGKIPQEYGIIQGDSRLKDSEAARIKQIADAICFEVLEKKAECVVFEDQMVFGGAKANMDTAKALCRLQGAVMVSLLRDCGLEPLPLNPMSARKAAGVDLKKTPKGKPKVKIKQRVEERLKEIGFADRKNDNINDAVILLLASKQLLDFGKENVA